MADELIAMLPISEFTEIWPPETCAYCMSTRWPSKATTPPVPPVISTGAAADEPAMYTLLPLTSDRPDFRVMLAPAAAEPPPVVSMLPWTYSAPSLGPALPPAVASPALRVTEPPLVVSAPSSVIVPPAAALNAPPALFSEIG